MGHGVGQAVDPHFDPHLKVHFYNEKHLKFEGFMFIGTQCDLWGRPDGTGYEKSKSREFPSTYFFFDPKFI